MKLCKKTFLIFVGMVSLSIDEINKAIDDAVKFVDKKSEKIKQSRKQNTSENAK